MDTQLGHEFVVMSWDLFESITETMEIMGDSDMMAALRRGIRDVQEGNLITLDQAKTELTSAGSS